MKLLLPALLLLLLTACGARSMVEFREEGEAVIRALVKELQPIQTRHELLRAAPRIKKLFNELTTIIIQAEEFQHKHPDSMGAEFYRDEYAAGEQLRLELIRIYAIAGCREVIEKCQEEALVRLDTFERRQKS